MRALKVALGLVVDDVRLVGVLALFLLVAFGLHEAGRPGPAALAVWVGLPASLAVSVNHQVRLKLRK
ncbi:MAG: hypothetical protein M0Z41_13070 [Peptococcaceae bacterium]|jgi:hypothetical protein|nr:hypothetical protein [Peptococcaceae bacterium]